MEKNQNRPLPGGMKVLLKNVIFILLMLKNGNLKNASQVTSETWESVLYAQA